MRVSQFLLSTLKEAPAEAELISHKYMLRAGLIKRLGSGLYTWMPLGLRILRKIEQIIREEMNRSGALEMLMPAVQPAELWQESGRWDVFGPQMLKIRDRHKHDFCFGPTHEEVIVDVARREIKSYRQLPRNFYQIQTKFRDEIRPRFGVMRAREFIMKDAYSFHADFASLEQTYALMQATYNQIFTRLGLKFRVVAADTGAMGGSASHEYHVLADSGEDAIAYCPDSDYAANIELATAPPPQLPHQPVTTGQIQKVATPDRKSCDDVAQFLKIPVAQTLKSLAVIAGGKFYLLLLRGDHQLNEIKLRKLPFLADFEFASEERIIEELGCPPGYLGPVKTHVEIVADPAVTAMQNFVCGANEEGYHFTQVNFGPDLALPLKVFDIRNVVAGDLSPDGKGTLEICRGIEVGHVFQLRTRYAEKMKATFLDESGHSLPMEMGCYGIGVSRIVAAAIEQGHDERGIIFPLTIAPFQLTIIPVNYRKSELVRIEADKFYQSCLMAGIEVLLDDREERPGAMFADQELIGIPHRIVIGERGLRENKLEYQGRRDEASRLLPLAEALLFIVGLINRH
ncbi:proline--tRNA ligase [Nitrosomonas mobilis]|uniref:Proline--tRNA ligase n=1 Tax=Nitrosomonas mobilis TaxID=51642 RepID=A0A1G5SF88_9PROT|nr:proline--tRNA ligase [Nitrosomonas mobilis]SCZ85865.1 prolyl-tRNA synthetase [Nitrosomonas mobilis]HNO76347.1 proline--tRNA ligase [Nitrosomonas mobilis]